MLAGTDCHAAAANEHRGCAECVTCKADPLKGNAYETTMAACDGKQACSVTVCYKPHQAPSSALQPCVGTSPVIMDPAFGCGKTYEVTYTCDSGWGMMWGMTFLIFATVAGAAYVGGGILAGSKTGGGKGLSAHPHHGRWMELQGLVQDGVVFARARAQGRQPGRAGGSVAPLLEVKEERRKSGGGSGGKEKTSKSSAGKEKKESKESSSSGNSPKSSGERKSKRSSGDDRGDAVVVPTAAAAAAAAAPAAAGTQAGDGGRWVHVPG